DWTAVRLSLSTASLERAMAAPELKSLRVGRAQPPPARSGWRDPPPGLNELFGPYDDAMRRYPRPATVEVADKADTGVNAALAQAAAVATRTAVGYAMPPPPPAMMPMGAPMPVAAAPGGPSSGRKSKAAPKKEVALEKTA